MPASLTTSCVAAAEGALGARLPLWSVLPFAALLLSIALLPLVVPTFWHHNRNKAWVSLLFGGPIAIWMGLVDSAGLVHALRDYVAFIALLATLYVIAGGIVVRGNLGGTPGANTGLLAVGAILASIVGTTGASMLLIRPLLRANRTRPSQTHIVVFFIFVVSNAGGLLTPLGDPPLFLGFLAGVPFWWTLGLAPQWLTVNGALLVMFYIVDSTLLRRADLATRGDLDEVAQATRRGLGLGGAINLLYLAGVVGVVLAAGVWRPPPGVQEGGMLAFLALSLVTTPRAVRRENDFSWGPIVEVAVVFAGIFAAMIPALAILQARGGELGLQAPWHYFWATGLLSSFLDNAPTYLTFTAVGSATLGTDARDLSQLLNTSAGAALLTAISLGAVLMGANTYIGNGPNFMVKAIAEAHGVRMPSFFGYMAWSGACLVPLFGVLTWVFLV